MSCLYLLWLGPTFKKNLALISIAFLKAGFAFKKAAMNLDIVPVTLYAKT